MHHLLLRSLLLAALAPLVGAIRVPVALGQTKAGEFDFYVLATFW
jgi:hypothetical protein